MRILIVKLGSIGDIVHTLPSLAAIRRAMPNAEISWVVERRAAEILRDNPILDRLIEVDTKALRRGLVSGETLRAPRQQLRQLRASAFELALDFQGLLKSASIARLSGARRVFGFSSDSLREPASRLLLSKSIRISKNLHVIRKNLALAAGALRIPIPKAPLARAKFFRMTCEFLDIGIDCDSRMRLAGSRSASRENPKTRRAPERRAIEADFSSPWKSKAKSKAEARS